MSNRFISRFTPSLQPREALEATFVEREPIAQRLLETIRESALTATKHHTLVVGPRGIGKTHLVSLIYHRVRGMEDLRDHLRIAWLREEEWGIDSFFELLRRVFIALRDEYGQDEVKSLLEEFHRMPRDRLEAIAADRLKSLLGGRTLLVLAENLDDIFDGLKESGQKALRAYLQENPYWTILATAQSLFGGVSLQTSPFYGFFRDWTLDGLSPEGAAELLARLARQRGDSELESFLDSPTGRARLRAIRHLAGGNYRVHAILSQFLTRDSLDALVEPVMQMLDDLTPYYQARMQRLEPVQRKIIEVLCEDRAALTPADTATQAFLDPSEAESQLRDLVQKGYVSVQEAGGEAHYELREPLMRLCLEVKKQRGEPIRLFVDFLRLWYPPVELKQRFDTLPPGALERDYVVRALQSGRDPTIDWVNACLRDFRAALDIENLPEALKAADDLIGTRGTGDDWLVKAVVLYKMDRAEEALEFTNGALARHLTEDAYYLALSIRGELQLKLGRAESALEDFRAVLKHSSNDARARFHIAAALLSLERAAEAMEEANQVETEDVLARDLWLLRAHILRALQRYAESLQAIERVLASQPDDDEAWALQALTLLQLGRATEAEQCIDNGLLKKPKSASLITEKANIRLHQNRPTETVQLARSAIEIDSSEPRRHGLLATGLLFTKRPKEAIESLDRFISMGGATGPDEAWAWDTRGSALLTLGKVQDALTAYDHAVRLSPTDAPFAANRASALAALGRRPEALEEMRRALKLDPRDANRWRQHAKLARTVGFIEEAIDAMDHAIELAPRSSALWIDRGHLYFQAGQLRDAMTAYETADSLDPRSPALPWRLAPLVGLKRWNEIPALWTEALWRLSAQEPVLVGIATAMLANLLTVDETRSLKKVAISTLVQCAASGGKLSVMMMALIQSVIEVRNMPIQRAKLREWRDLWWEVGESVPELRMGRRLLDAAVNYLINRDPKIFLRLPIEERTLLAPLAQ